MPIDPAKRQQAMSFLERDIPQRGANDYPFLAHYTSMDALEKILRSDEIWMSHPLLMNDSSEVVWGITEGMQAIERDTAIPVALGSSATRHRLFIDGLHAASRAYAERNWLDTYIACFSEHPRGDTDGRLSMWRGYGGNGTGAALVIDPNLMESFPSVGLVLDQVQYLSLVERAEWVNGFLTRVATILHSGTFPDADLAEVAGLVFDRLKLAAIFSKHPGFKEEDEWRVVYMPERDEADALRPLMSHHNGPRGLEPKLKLKIAAVPGGLGIALDSIVDKIVLGPNRSSALVQGTVQRMVASAGKPMLAPKVCASGIPYRG